MNQIARNHFYQLDSDSWALFAQGTFNFTDNLRLTVGVRYTEENKDVVSTQFLSDLNSGLTSPGDSYFLHLIQATSFNAYAYDFREEPHDGCAGAVLQPAVGRHGKQHALRELLPGLQVRRLYGRG
jgi:outer membrane receptor protein involved in Fe transport